MRMPMSSTPFYSQSSRRKEQKSLSEKTRAIATAIATAITTAIADTKQTVSHRASPKVAALGNENDIALHRIIPHRPVSCCSGICVAVMDVDPKGFVLLFWFPGFPFSSVDLI
jgi:hypothetical protein